MADDDKTEPATGRKRGELRKKGQVPKSPDFTSSVVYMVLVMAINSLGANSFSLLQHYMVLSLSREHDTNITFPVLVRLLTEMALLLAQVSAPIVMTAMVVGVGINLMQTGFLVATEALKPDFNSINPLAGIKSLFSTSGLVETIKAVLKIIMIGYLAYSTISGGYPLLLATIRQDFSFALRTITELLYRLAIRLGMFLLVLSSLDFFWQRYSYEKNIRMTKEEVKQEMKQQESSPLVKGKIRSRMREMIKKRMLDDVPKADMIVVNPTHYAVALKYDQMSMRAPRVVAKGVDHMAAKIREIAEEHDVPIVQNPPLARGLYKSAEVGDEIPGDYYAAVAEVLAYVYQINSKRRRRAGVGR